MPTELTSRLDAVLMGKEFASLLMVIRVAHHGSFTFALYNNDVERAVVIDQLRAKIAPLPLFEFTIAPDRPNPRRYLDDLTEAQRNERAVVCFNDIEAGFPDSLRYLDFQREVFAAHPHVLIVWIKPETHGVVATEAPNIFSQHSGVFDLRLPPRRIDAATIRATQSADLITADLEEKQRSLALFESLLADYEADPDADRATLLDLHLRIGTLRDGISDNAGALREFERACALVNSETPDSVRAELDKWTGDAHLCLSHHEQAAAVYESALPLYRRDGEVLGEANCIGRLGDIALDCSDHDGARARFEEALSLYRRVGEVLGEAGCIYSLGEIALDRSDHDGERARFDEALTLYESIPEPDSIGWTHHRLACIARDDQERRWHVRAAREAWTSIHFDHLVDALREEFGEPE